MQINMTKGSVAGSMLRFAFPMMAGNLLQQFYNVADTLIVGRFIGPDALAAVGASSAVVIFLTSMLLGLCMGSGVLFSMLYGAGERERMKTGFLWSFLFVGGLSILLETAALLFTSPLLRLLQIPTSILELTYDYLHTIFYGIICTFLYNYFATILRSVGNSLIPLLFLGISALLNIALDILFIVSFSMGVQGAALATVLAQALSAGGIALYFFFRFKELRPSRRHMRFERSILRQIIQYSLLTSVQQSIMNFGILLVQGLVNSFGVAVMAAFAAAVKIDAFAYMPVQDFGNAFSTFIAQNHGAGEKARIKKGLRAAVCTAFIFCAFVSAAVVLFAEGLMAVFIDPVETEIIGIGAQYLRVEGACYVGIGCLFLLYGLYRGLGRPGFSVVLTVVSLGTRVLLAYLLAPIPAIGLWGIWWSVPIGWFLADALGLLYCRRVFRRLPEKGA